MIRILNLIRQSCLNLASQYIWKITELNLCWSCCFCWEKNAQTKYLWFRNRRISINIFFHGKLEVIPMVSRTLKFFFNVDFLSWNNFDLIDSLQKTKNFLESHLFIQKSTYMWVVEFSGALCHKQNFFQSINSISVALTFFMDSILEILCCIRSFPWFSLYHTFDSNV